MEAAYEYKKKRILKHFIYFGLGIALIQYVLRSRNKRFIVSRLGESDC